ncbi:MAG: NTP transferase domain-containing protein [Candidatus Falkowbacteria bacterium]|nr:NTP transferase domain-containing protein [Candidatus Falkowbacteria bacterium]
MIKVVVLAAGKGVRMQDTLPKVLVPINGRPMIEYLVKSIIASGVDSEPIVVVSPDNKEMIQNALAAWPCRFAIQRQQLGTGHALACALPEIKEKADHVVCFYGDHPFVQPATIKKLATYENGVLTIMTATLPDFADWRQGLYYWGRIVRHEGRVEAIVECKDATEEVKIIKEVNPGFYCFEIGWLRRNINKLNKNNVQQEYYLTDLVKVAFSQGIKINTLPIDPKESVGINSKEELKLAESLA